MDMSDSLFPILSESFKSLGVLTAFLIAPLVLILMTAFTRISIVLTFLRQALSISVPSGQILFGLSLILTGYVMRPIIVEISENAVMPYFQKKIEGQAMIEKAWPPLRNFMLHNTREKDLELFLDMAKVELPPNQPLDLNALPWYCVIPAFVLSELRVAFMMGFLLFLPFLIIDMVVTSILMSMGIFMLPPTMISLPFKLLLFLVVDGWHLIVQQLVGGFQP